MIKRVSQYVQVLEDCKPWKPVLIRTLLVMGFYLVCLYIMSVMNVVAGIRYPKKSEVLPDVGFDILPAVHENSIPNTILTVSIVCTAIRLVMHQKGITILRRFMIVHGITALMRGLTMVATSYPDPSLVCHDYEPPSSTSLFWHTTLVSMKLTCGDLMFSGHTILFVLIGLLWHKYTRMLGKCIFWFISWLGCVSLIITRLHYTNDVLVASYVAVTTWNLYHEHKDQWFIPNWLDFDYKKCEYKEMKELEYILCTI